MRLPGSFLDLSTLAWRSHRQCAARIDSLRDVSVEGERLSRCVSRAVGQIFSTGYALSEEADGGTNTAVVTLRLGSDSERRWLYRHQ